MKKQLGVMLVTCFLVSGEVVANAPLSQQGEPRTMRRQRTILLHSDSDLTAKARRTLERDDDLSFEARNVNVRVRNGRAILQGAVRSPDDFSELKRKMMAVEGIRAVDNKLTISE